MSDLKLKIVNVLKMYKDGTVTKTISRECDASFNTAKIALLELVVDGVAERLERRTELNKKIYIWRLKDVKQ